LIWGRGNVISSSYRKKLRHESDYSKTYEEAQDMVSSESITTYIGTYTRRESFVDGKAEGIYIYHLDLSSGELTYANTVTGLGTDNPSFVTLGPDKRHLYAVNEFYESEGPHGTVSAFAIDPVTKDLIYLNQQSTHGLAPCYACIEPEGRYCLVANYETGSVCVLPIQKDGRLGEATDTVQFSGSGPNPDRQTGPHAHMVVSTPNSRSILVVDLGTDRLMLFDLDLERGTLSPVDPPWVQLPPGTGPRHLAFHPHRNFVYAISELQSTVTVFRYTVRQNTIEEPQTISTLPVDFTGQNLGAEIKMAPSGRFVYISNRGHNSLAIYAVDQETGQLSLVGHEATQGVGPRDFTIDPSGTLLLVANQDSNTVVTFWINQDSGTLRATGHVAAVPTPVCLHLLSA
jgi:6-phosphogluconolactonase